MNIKKNMFDTTIPNDPTNMTATEINQRTGELMEQLNNAFGRLINEFLYPLVKRLVEVLQNFGYIDPELDVNRFNGFGFKIKINTNLSNQQKYKELQNNLQFLQIAASVDPTFQFIGKVVKMEELSVNIAKLSGIDYEFIRSADEIRALEEKAAQDAQMQQQQAMVDQVNMSNAIEQGKADAQRNSKML